MYAQQVQAPVLWQTPAPTLPGAVAPAQTGGLDIASLMNTIFPLFTMMMVFSMILPMFKQMGGAFGGKD